MFSSLASLIFGSNTSATTNSEANNQPIGQQRELDRLTDENLVRLDADNTINVTSSTPSVTGCHNDIISIREQGSGQTSQGGKRNKNKRNKSNRHRRQQSGQKETPSLAKLLTPNESCDEELDEDEWFIVEKEDEDDSLPRTDSEEELSVVEVKGSSVVAVQQPISSTSNTVVQSERRRQHINSHSLYSGPRPQQQRNLLQRARNSTRSGTSLNLSTLSPPRNITDVGINAGIIPSISSTSADIDGITQSLYAARPSLLSSSLPPAVCPSGNSSSCGSDAGTNISMEESWFVTPPPCFTSIGPVNMETSPYENLLIEHPSMSVYHSIRSAQEAAESFVNLDLGVGESQQRPRPTAIAAVSATVAVEPTTNGRNLQSAPQQTRTSSARADRFSAAQLKQEMFARSTQKSHDKKERQNLCRSAIKRSNKVRDFQSKSNRQRRSDMQHCKILSGANNNRKCCY